MNCYFQVFTGATTAEKKYFLNTVKKTLIYTKHGRFSRKT